LFDSLGDAPPEALPFNPLAHSCSTASTERSAEEINAFLQNPVLRIRMLGINIPPPIFSFEEALLPPEVTGVIVQNEWSDPTPIQKVALPIILAGRDMIGIAKTGSGKTGAFAIPAILHCLENRDSNGTHVLVLSPVRELAQQTQTVISGFASVVSLRAACIYGGEQSRREQVQVASTHPEIVIGTPGRLADLVRAGALDLSTVSIVIVDEADNMLRQNFVGQCRALLLKCQTRRQTLMWSATWPKDVRDLAKEFLNDDHVQVVADASERTVNANIHQEIIRIDRHSVSIEDIRNVVHGVLLDSGNSAKMIIFTNSRKRTVDVACQLRAQDSLLILEIRGDMSQNERNKAMNNFRTAQPPCALIATSVAERGMNFDDVTHVIVSEMPRDIDDYIHRIGRTARAGRTGRSIALFVVEKDAPIAKKLTKVLKQAKQEVPEWLSNLATDVGSDRYRSKPSRY
jgi:ATP-dependent RNA helicase DDX5/DBP2